MGNSLGEAFGCLITILIIGAIVIIGFGSYFVYDKTGDGIIESRTIIRPDYRLESKGKKVDTIYIYTFKRWK